MSWEQDITEELQQAENAAVRFDVEQHPSVTEQNRAKSNIGIGSVVTQISGDDYKITF